MAKTKVHSVEMLVRFNLFRSLFNRRQCPCPPTMIFPASLVLPLSQPSEPQQAHPDNHRSKAILRSSRMLPAILYSAFTASSIPALICFIVLGAFGLLIEQPLQQSLQLTTTSFPHPPPQHLTDHALASALLALSPLQHQGTRHPPRIPPIPDDLPRSHLNDGECGGQCAKQYQSAANLIFPQAGANLVRAFCHKYWYRKKGDIADHPLLLVVGPDVKSAPYIARALASLGVRTLLENEILQPVNARGGVSIESAEDRKLSPVYKAARASNRTLCHSSIDSFDYVGAFAEVDAVVAESLPDYWYHLYSSFPNSRVIYNYRANVKPINLRVVLPYLRPCKYDGADGWAQISEDGAWDLSAATRDFVECVVPPDRLLAVDFENERMDSASLWNKLGTFVGVDISDGYFEQNCTFVDSEDIVECVA